MPPPSGQYDPRGQSSGLGPSGSLLGGLGSIRPGPPNFGLLPQHQASQPLSQLNLGAGASGAGSLQAGGDEAGRWLNQQRGELQKAELAVKKAAAESAAFVGIISRLSISTGLGIIESADCQQQFGGDAQIPRELLAGLEVGDTVVFKVSPPRGQVSWLRKLLELTHQRQRILEVEAPLPAATAQESGTEYLGFVNSFQPDPGFGLISCAQTRQAFGHDVLLHRNQFLDLNIGDAVHFRVALNSGNKPVARGVRKAMVEGAAPAPMQSTAPPPPPEEAKRRRRSRSRSGSMSSMSRDRHDRRSRDRRDRRRSRSRR